MEEMETEKGEWQELHRTNRPIPKFKMGNSMGSGWPPPSVIVFKMFKTSQNLKHIIVGVPLFHSNAVRLLHGAANYIGGRAEI